MPEYIMLYRSTDEARRQAMGSPERAQESMKVWRAWFQDMTTKGTLKSPGQPLEDAGKVVKKKVITDGPFAETKDVIGGYSVIEARDLDHAAQIASGCPIVEGGGSVEVRQVRKLEM